ncbi:MAG: hypothetical protein AAFQ94_16670 [Bacteroidota bacterium]
MEDLSFIQFFITEDVYLRPEDRLESIEEAHSETEVETPSISEVTPSPSVKPLKIAKADPSEKANALKQQVSESQTKDEQSVQESQQTRESATDYTPPVYEGHFLKQILIVVHSAGLGFEHKELLLKILGAINLTKEDVAILPSGHIKSKADFDWMAGSNKKGLVAFGLPDKWKQQIIPQSELYQMVSHNGYQLLFSDSLAEINGNVNAKKQLWTAIQKLK